MDKLKEVENKLNSAYPEKDGQVTNGDVVWLIDNLKEYKKIIEDIKGTLQIEDFNNRMKLSAIEELVSIV